MSSIPVEFLLPRATTVWLPQRTGPTTSGLRLLAERLVHEHSDHWLADMLTADPTPAWTDAARLLARALSHNASGERDSALREARRAAPLFRSLTSPAGDLRSDAEALYALSRTAQTHLCLDLSLSLIRRLRQASYPWIHIQALLARSQCLHRAGDFSGAFRTAENAAEMAQRHRFPQLRLRALGILGSEWTLAGSLRAARRINYDGLQEYWQGTYPPLRAYQFYSDLSHIAERSRLWHLGYLICREAVPFIELAGIPTTEAMARFRLATFAGRIGREQEANAEIARAGAFLNRSPQTPSTRTLLAENQILLARGYLDAGSPGPAGRLLATVRPEDVSASYYLAVRWHGARTALARAGNASTSSIVESEALAAAETALTTTSTARDRADWARETAPIYRDLVRINLDRNDSHRAFAIWQSFRAATVSRGTPWSAATAAARLQAPLPVPSLSFIQFEDRAHAWFIGPSGVHSAPIDLNASQAEALCGEFRRLASSPSSDLFALRALGQSLYRVFLAVHAAELSPGMPLAVEADGPCSSIPFELLVTSPGAYLIENVPILYSTSLLTAAPPTPLPSHLRAVIVGDPRLGGDFAENYPELPDAFDEATLAAGLFPSSLVLTRREATPAAVRTALRTAGLFHFAGHGVSHGEAGALLLAAPDSAAFLDASSLDGAFPDCLLAVLSACSTAAGQAAGPFNSDSLVQAFLRAGVPHVVATRWAVDSRFSRRLVARLYHHLLRGEWPAAALRQAQLDVRNASPVPIHPAHWAGYQIFGSPYLRMENRP